MKQANTVNFSSPAQRVEPERSFPSRAARALIRRVGKLSPRLASTLLDQLPNADEEGMQVFRPDPEALRAAPVAGDVPTHTLWRFGSLDATLASGEWDSGPGRHVIKFDFDEWVHILEGEVNITVQGQTRTLRAGDAAMFRAGLSMTWDVPKYVRKVWVHRYIKDNLLERAARKLLGPFVP